MVVMAPDPVIVGTCFHIDLGSATVGNLDELLVSEKVVDYLVELIVSLIATLEERPLCVRQSSCAEDKS